MATTCKGYRPTHGLSVSLKFFVRGPNHIPAKQSYGKGGRASRDTDGTKRVVTEHRSDMESPHVGLKGFRGSFQATVLISPKNDRLWEA
jgi:hypothetical protein